MSLITAAISRWYYHRVYVPSPLVCLLRILPPGFFFALLALIPLAASSFAQTTAAPEIVFRNIDPSVTYVGSKACASAGCHQEISRDYPATPMGHSMALANIPQSWPASRNPSPSSMRRTVSYYVAYQSGGDLYQSVYELDKKGRKTYTATHKMDYVVGSASLATAISFVLAHGCSRRPFPYYSHSAQWELSPGYDLDDIGFTRSIATGCSASTTESTRSRLSVLASWPSVAKHVTAPARYTCARCRRTQANNLPRSRWTAPSSTPQAFAARR